MMKRIRSAILMAVLGLAGSWSMMAHAAFDIMTTRPNVRATDATAKTAYPIVLVHGAFGPTNIAGFYDAYWYQIPETLARHGAEVYVAALSAGGLQRNEELRAQVQRVLDVTGAKKVNLITHSQGALDARYVAFVNSASIASVTTTAGPHKGVALAEIPAEQLPILVTLLGPVVNAAGDIIAALNGTFIRTNAGEWVGQLTRKGMAEFNRQYPTAGIGDAVCATGADTEVRNGNVQKLYSWTGNRHGVKNLGLTNMLVPDPLDWLAYAASVLLDFMGFHESDGVVPVCSALYGKVISKSYNWNHFDETNPLFGNLAFGAADPNAVFHAHATRLKAAGL
jgi:triacylglycerol lipase